MKQPLTPREAARKRLTAALDHNVWIGAEHAEPIIAAVDAYEALLADLERLAADDDDLAGPLTDNG